MREAHRVDLGQREHLSPKELTSIREGKKKSIRVDLGRRGCEKLISAILDQREHPSLNELTSIGEGRTKSICADLGWRGCKKLTMIDSGRIEHPSLIKPTSVREGIESYARPGAPWT